ncbi:CHAT domain-containing protein [Russula vinacea]|nr:CHAT domain-containing protein [Russula vinacea]
MQDTLTFAPTLDIQHSRLVAMRDRYENLPLDHASYHVSMGQLKQAIETLERGRALIWSEMRGLRTSIDQIRATDSPLADNFTAVNRELETLTLTISSNSNDDGRDGGFVRMDPFGHLVVQQRKLLGDRNKLILQIQALPGFETFLKAPFFDNLQFAAARGPLLGARKEGLDSNQYEDTLCSVLKELYELVGRPVIQRLNELKVPKQSRVWWCPTSVFCSLPLHAMGPIKSDDGLGPPRYFLDLYIPSYTPTLSTLIESNNPGSNTSDKPSILLVSQPDASLPGARGEMQVVQTTSTQVTTLSSAMATPTTVLDRLRDHRFAHIACHGILEPGKPFDASFKLYRGERLSLLDIVRSRLPEAEFAFLSACHTAELTEESIADEALHLAAAMQYCGFRSVVGTMWAMVDVDGRDLARNFYKHVFSDRQEGTRYHERTAEALRDAAKNLRRKNGMTLERWVNFVHCGA